jgi:uncharacterized protein (TIGR00255 family)
MPAIHSMTGYAMATKEVAHGVLNVEIRSVNHRYLDIQFRMPDELRPVESALRELLAARLNRGKVECRVSFTAGGGNRRTPEIDQVLFAQLLDITHRVKEKLPGAADLTTGEVLRWPGILGPDTLPIDDMREACRGLLETVLAEFATARAREGEKLKAMLIERADSAQAHVRNIGPRMPQLIAAFQEKLALRLKEALGNADDERIRQEVVLYANKIDVDEELSRLTAHFSELRRILAAGGAVGKRLDFLMQELNREANTLGSKAGDVTVTQASMDLKLLIEQMREQIQNIE